MCSRKLFNKTFMAGMFLGIVAVIIWLRFGLVLRLPVLVFRSQQTVTRYKQPVTHIGFLKVHKAASSTIQNILMRYSWKYNLTPVLSSKNRHTVSDFIDPKSWGLMPMPNNETGDILFIHSRFSAEGFRKHLPKDAIFIACVREPFDRMVSNLNYARVTGWLPFPIPGKEHTQALVDYLKNPRRYDKSVSSQLHNSMTVDFGYPDLYHKNTTLFQTYLQRLHKFFDLVIVAERFDESIILMRRLLKWKFEDVLFLKNNVFRHNTVNQSLRDIDREWSALDYTLYDFFNKTLYNKLAEQDVMFWDEVNHLKDVNKQLDNFCSGPLGELYIQETIFYSMLTFNKQYCDLVKMKELTFLRNFENQRTKELTNYGTNYSYNNNIMDNLKWSTYGQLLV